MASITKEIELPTRNELIECMMAISELISQQALCINGYKPKKFYPIFVDHEKKMECEKINEKFMKKYPNCSI